jgi:hypothetical protein
VNTPTDASTATRHSDEDDTVAPEPAQATAQPSRRRPRQLRRGVVIGVTVAVLAAGVVTLTDRLQSADTSDTTAETTAGTALAEVTQQTITARVPINGTLGYAGHWDIVNQLQGTITALPAVGSVVQQGDVAYRVDGRPVLLLYGDVPAWRALAAGSTAAAMSGPDVAQFNAALVALGHAADLDLDPASDQFSWLTRQAVKNLQTALGLQPTGTLSFGDVMFLPGPVRVTSVAAALGAPAGPGQAVLATTSTTPIVTVDLPTARRSQIQPGDAVEVDLPDLTTVAGTVSHVGTVATPGSAGSAATIPVAIALADPGAAAGLDAAPVLVSITTATVDDALAVPVTALLAPAGGGYAVEVDENGVRTLVPVELGIFDDRAGVVQVTGSGLAAGQRVVVPAT